jgi:hypothetical protein
MAQLFGFEIVRKKEAEEKAQPDRLVTFAPEIKDDGAVVVAEGGVFGTYLDLEGSARTESDLVAKYREMSLQPEVESAIDDIVNEFVSYDSDYKLVDINLDDLEFGNKVKDKIREEFKTIVQLLDFNNSGYEIVRRWYIDGRLYYHAIIDVQNPREGIQEIRQLLRSLADNGTTVFVSSHLLSELELISEYLVMLRKGEVVFAGPIQELFDQQQPFMIVKTEREEDLQKIIEIAQNAGHKSHKRDGTAHIEGPAEWAGVLNKLAFESGILITQLSPQVPNLEETFFELTGDQK